MIIMFNKNCALRELPISKNVLGQIDYDSEELFIVVYLLLEYCSSVWSNDKAKSIYTTCELMVANTTGDLKDLRRVKDKLINSLITLQEKGLLDTETEFPIMRNTLLKINMENLIPKENDELFHIDLEDYFKLCQLKGKEFKICLQLYLLIKSCIDNDSRFLKVATMLSQPKLTTTRFYGDKEVSEWITKPTCKKYLGKLCELGIISEIDATPKDLNFTLPCVYCRGADINRATEVLEEVVETLEIVKQVRFNEGNVNKNSWSWKVRERDGHRCALCGETEGVMHAHHLNAKALFPKQSLDLNNGVTLCQKCHFAFHSEYGVGRNTKEQFEEFTSSFNK